MTAETAPGGIGGPATGPAPSAELMSLRDLEALGYMSADRLGRHCRSGALHAHRDRDRAGVHWRVAMAVARVWKAGGDDAAQRDACPLCPAPAVVVPLPRARQRHRATRRP